MDDTDSIDSKDPNNLFRFYIGLVLAIISSFFIGISFIIKKKGLLKLEKLGHVRAGFGGHGYLRQWIWWGGFIFMAIGELVNFAAYAFAPASLVTPLGALSVIVTAILSAKYLNERLNLLGKIGCSLCILGSTMIVLHAPKEEENANMEELLLRLQNPLFIIYMSMTIGLSISIIVHFGPKYGNRNVTVYLILCSTIGSLSVMCCKGLGIALRETINGTKNEMSNWLTWLLLFSVIFFIMLQMNYLNKSLDLFNTSIVTTIYYVFFTSSVILASNVLFEEWKNMTVKDILGTFCGFFNVVVAIFLLNAFKEMNISLNDVRQMTRLKRETRLEESNLNSNSVRRDFRDEELLISGSDAEQSTNNSYGSAGIIRNDVTI